MSLDDAEKNEGEVEEKIATRQSFEGTAKDYYDIVHPVAKKHGKNYIRFDEHQQPIKAKLNPTEVTKQCSLDYLEAVHKAQPNMCYPRAIVNKGTKMILAEFAETWKIKKEHSDDYVTTLERRAMNIHRKVSQAAAKTKARAKWTERLPWKLADQQIVEVAASSSRSIGPRQAEPATEDEADASARDSEGFSYFYGYDKEVKMAWRRSLKKMSKPELCDWCGRKDGDQDGDALVATWTDGMEMRIKQITVEQHDVNVEARGNGGGQPIQVIYEGEHKATRHRIRVSKRKDRYTLMSLYEQGMQRCSIPIFAFENNDDWEPGKESAEAEKKAGEFMTDLAIKFALDVVARTQLYELRDQRAKAAGLNMKVPKGKIIPEMRSEGSKRAASVQISGTFAKKQKKKKKKKKVQQGQPDRRAGATRSTQELVRDPLKLEKNIELESPEEMKKPKRQRKMVTKAEDEKEENEEETAEPKAEAPNIKQEAADFNKAVKAVKKEVVAKQRAQDKLMKALPRAMQVRVGGLMSVATNRFDALQSQLDEFMLDSE